MLKTEKWVETENIETNAKIYVKVSFSVVKVAPDAKAKAQARLNNFVDSKSYETSPRLHYTLNKSSLQSSQTFALQSDDTDSEPIASFRKSSSTNNGPRLPPTGMVIKFVENSRQ